MSQTSQPSSVLVFITGLPSLPAANPAGAQGDLPNKLRRFVLRRLRAQDVNDMAAIYMPLNGAGGAENDESVHSLFLNGWLSGKSI